MNLKEILAGVAPVLATAIGGPLGGVAVKMGLEALKIEPKDPKTNEKALLAALIKDPDAPLKMIEAQNNFSIRLKELGIREEEIAAADRDSARKRQIATGDKTPQVLAYSLTVMVAAMFWCLLKYQVPKETGPIIYMLVGGVIGTWGTAMAYFLGSSSGSAEKNRMLGEIMKKN